MTTDSLEPFEPKEQSKASVPSAPARSAVSAPSKNAPAELVDDDIAVSSKSQRRLAPRLSRPRLGSLRSMAPRDIRLMGFVAAFGGGAIATLFLLAVVAFGFAGANSNRV